MIKSYSDLKKNDAYELMYEEYLDDIKTAGIILRHKKSGARICVMANDDENKMFCAAFKTPPENSTGVPHIIEHSVLNGSKNFPLRDPFMTLMKSSLQTFLNAMTFPDKTIYPVASCNDKDFKNLMHVYMDSVFYPNIYNNKYTFMQEGWHYEMDNPDDELKINGVVYSEMKGALSSPEGLIYDATQMHLLPDSVYGVNSGGDPDVIPTLTYEDFIKFHSTYYHPINSYLFVYGNCDMDERLEWMDKEYLSKFDIIDFHTEIKPQPRWNEKTPRRYRGVYDGGENEETEGKAYFSFSSIACSSLDSFEKRACDILGNVLIDSDSAPVKEALIKAGIGEEIYGGFEEHMIENAFLVIVKNANEKDLDRFYNILMDTVREQVEKGINEKAIRAAINTFEFNFRESNYGGFPKGLDYAIKMLSSWLYDDSAAFLYLHTLRDIEKLKEKVGTGFYEDLARKYILESDHSLLVTLVPEKGYTDKNNTILKEKLAEYKKGLSKEEIEKIVSETKSLREYQAMPPTEAELTCIPSLERSDIKEDTVPLYIEEKKIGGCKAVFHDVDTLGITYANLYFDFSKIPNEYVPYVGILAGLLGRVDTDKRKYSDLSVDIKLNTGSITFVPTVIRKKASQDDYASLFGVNIRVLADKVEYAIDTVSEILTSSRFDDKQRLRALLAEMKSEKQGMIMMAGHMVAMSRAASYYSPIGCLNEQLSGLDYYLFISNLVNEFDKKADMIIENLKKVSNCIFDPNSLILSLATDKEGYENVEKSLPKLVSSLESLERAYLGEGAHFEPVRKNEGIVIPSRVQYVVRAGNLKKSGIEPDGAMNIVINSVDIDHLYQNIRVKGGAYGCGCRLDYDSGDMMFYSYRDPNLAETDKVYFATEDFVKNYDIDDAELTKNVIGTFAKYERPMSPVQKAQRSFIAYISGKTYDEIVKERKEMLSITPEKFRECAKIFGAVCDQGYICAVGSSKIREGEGSLFSNILVIE